MSKKIDIVSLFLGDYSMRLSGREIARMARANHQTALNHLNELVKHKILGYDLRGRNKEHYLEMDNYRSRLLIQMAETKKSFDILENKELKLIIEGIADYAEALILFGSFASLKHDKDSDVDLVVVGKSDKDRISKVSRRYSREINMEYISFAELERSLKDKKALAIEISKNHVFFGDISKLVDVFIRWYLR